MAPFPGKIRFGVRGQLQPALNDQTSTPMRSPKPMSSSAKASDSSRPARTEHSNARTGTPDSRSGRNTRAAHQGNQNAGPASAAPRPDDPGFDTNLIGSLR
jgi:hypothetical protein